MAVLDLAVTRSSYGPVTVLRDVRIVVDEGELVAVLGGNGAGKTTLLRTISGVLVRAQGKVRFEGRDITRMAAHRRARSGIVHVPEGRRVFPDLTVTENLRMGAYSTRRRNSVVETAYDRVYELFPVLEHRQNQQATSLSGGEQQMLAIARGLMADPRLLMVDEASLGLSPAFTRQVFDVLDRVRRQGTAVVMVEQNARSALAVADRAYIMERGQIALAGRTSELIDDARVAGLYLGGHSVKTTD